MQLLKPTYKTSIEAVNAVVTDKLTAIQVDYLPGKNVQDPYDLHITVWVLIENTIYCYYIIAEGMRWVTRKYDRNDFTETSFISCPSNFLKAVNLALYDQKWINAVKAFHRNK